MWAECWWLMPVILTAWKTEIEVKVWGQHLQKVSDSSSQAIAGCKPIRVQAYHPKLFGRLGKKKSCETSYQQKKMSPQWQWEAKTRRIKVQASLSKK
jgi:hypothetical protein